MIVNWRVLLRNVIGLLVCCWSMDAVHPVLAAPIELLVPAYGHPCCGAGKAMWTELAAVVQRDPVALNVILNPNSGPGSGPIDMAYIGSSEHPGPLVQLRQSGARVVAYVHTQYGERPWEAVQADIDRYLDSDYWRGAGRQLDGLFVDEMSNDWAKIPYYQKLRDYLRERLEGASIIGNPGTRSIINTDGPNSKWSWNDYLGTVDTMVVFEDSAAAYESALRWPPETQQGESKRFAHIVHSAGSDELMRRMLELARERHAGMIYVTDDQMPNPYDRLPTYWSSEAHLLTVPEPTRGAWSLVLLFLPTVRRHCQHGWDRTGCRSSSENP